MLRQRSWSGAELRAFVDDLRRNDPELFAELDGTARRAAAGEAPEGLDPAAPAFNRLVRETAGGAEDLTYESIVLRKGRPVLPIQRNEVDVRVIDDDAAELIRARLHAASAFLRAAIPAVGRIEVQNNPFYDWVGTGWLVAPEVIVTNRHVAQAFGMRDAARFVFRPGLDASRPQAGRIDFLEEIGLGEPLEVALAEIVWIAPDAGPDVAFLRLAAARPDVAPIALADAARERRPGRGDRLPRPRQPGPQLAGSWTTSSARSTTRSAWRRGSSPSPARRSCSTTAPPSAATRARSCSTSPPARRPGSTSAASTCAPTTRSPRASSAG